MFASVDRRTIQLHKTLRRKEWDKARRTIQREADPQSLLDGRDHYGDTALSIAICRRAPVDLIFTILEKYGDCAFAENEVGSTPLHTAVIWGASYDVLLLLIQKNPDALEHRNGDRKTPRDYLDEGKLDERCKQLLRQGFVAAANKGNTDTGSDETVTKEDTREFIRRASRSSRSSCETAPTFLDSEPDPTLLSIEQLELARRCSEEQIRLNGQFQEMKKMLEKEHERTVDLEKSVVFSRDKMKTLSQSFEEAVSDLKDTVDKTTSKLVLEASEESSKQHFKELSESFHVAVADLKKDVAEMSSKQLAAAEHNKAADIEEFVESSNRQVLRLSQSFEVSVAELKNSVEEISKRQLVEAKHIKLVDLEKRVEAAREQVEALSKSFEVAFDELKKSFDGMSKRQLVEDESRTLDLEKRLDTSSQQVEALSKSLDVAVVELKMSVEEMSKKRLEAGSMQNSSQEMAALRQSFEVSAAELKKSVNEISDRQLQEAEQNIDLDKSVQDSRDQVAALRKSFDANMVELKKNMEELSKKQCLQAEQWSLGRDDASIIAREQIAALGESFEVAFAKLENTVEKLAQREFLDTQSNHFPVQGKTLKFGKKNDDFPGGDTTVDFKAMAASKDLKEAPEGSAALSLEKAEALDQSFGLAVMELKKNLNELSNRQYPQAEDGTSVDEEAINSSLEHASSLGTLLEVTMGELKKTVADMPRNQAPCAKSAQVEQSRRMESTRDNVTVLSSSLEVTVAELKSCLDEITNKNRFKGSHEVDVEHFVKLSNEQIDVMNESFEATMSQLKRSVKETESIQGVTHGYSVGDQVAEMSLSLEAGLARLRRSVDRVSKRQKEAEQKNSASHKERVASLEQTCSLQKLLEVSVTELRKHLEDMSTKQLQGAVHSKIIDHDISIPSPWEQSAEWGKSLEASISKLKRSVDKISRRQIQEEETSDSTKCLQVSSMEHVTAISKSVETSMVELKKSVDRMSRRVQKLESKVSTPMLTTQRELSTKEQEPKKKKASFKKKCSRACHKLAKPPIRFAGYVRRRVPRRRRLPASTSQNDEKKARKRSMRDSC